MKKDKSLKVHIQYDTARAMNSWIVADSQKLMDQYAEKLIKAHEAIEDWIPTSGAKLILLTDVVAPNLFRDLSLINPLEITKSDLKNVPPILCVNDAIFEMLGNQPTLPAIKFLKSYTNIKTLQKYAESGNFHLIGLCNAI